VEKNLIYEGAIMQTCKGKTRTGAACRAPAGAGGLCFFHANPDSAKTLGQIGGRNNRRSVVDVEVPDNMTAVDVSKVTAKAIRLLLSGDLRAREACALAQLCNSLYRVIPSANLEARVTMLEEQVAQEESVTSPDPNPTGSDTDGTGAAETEAQLEAEQEAPGQAAHDDAEGIASDSTAAATSPEETAEPDVTEEAERDDRRSVATIEEEEPNPGAFATIEDEEGVENTSDGSSEEEGEP
jgi:hypothetical protein